MAQLVKLSTLGFGSGHDLIVHEFNPCICLSAGSTEPAWHALSPSHCPFPACILSLSKTNELKKKKGKVMRMDILVLFLTLVEKLSVFSH